MSVSIRMTSFIFFYSLDIRVFDVEIKWPKTFKNGLNFAPHQHKKVIPIVVARCNLMRSKFDTFGVIFPHFISLFVVCEFDLGRPISAGTISERLACYLFMCHFSSFQCFPKFIYFIRA